MNNNRYLKSKPLENGVSENNLSENSLPNHNTLAIDAVNTDTIAINMSIEHIDVKGQYISLAVPIRLFGQLSVSKLLADYKTTEQMDRTQSSDHLLSKRPVLQIGVDEAGRGPLLGSVNVAAAILPPAWSDLIEGQPLRETPLSILTDSKQLSEKKRDILYPLIKQHTIGYIIAEIPAAVIDQVNILQATMLGMRLCSEALLAALVDQSASDNSSKHCNNVQAQTIKAEILFDGNRCPELDYLRLAQVGIAQSNIDCQAWVKGDARHTSMAAASVLAKVSRDQTMYALDIQHPQYSIAKHKGYPTRMHMEAINKYGVLPEHRRSFAPVKHMFENQ